MGRGTGRKGYRDHAAGFSTERRSPKRKLDTSQATSGTHVPHCDAEGPGQRLHGTERVGARGRGCRGGGRERETVITLRRL